MPRENQPYLQPFTGTKLSRSVFPLPVTEIYNPVAVDMEYPDLFKECKEGLDSIAHINTDQTMVHFDMTNKHANEIRGRKQSGSTLEERIYSCSCCCSFRTCTHFYRARGVLGVWVRCAHSITRKHRTLNVSNSCLHF